MIPTTRTRRLRLATKLLDEAQAAEMVARQSGDERIWKIALTALEAAENEFAAAVRDAQAREKVGEGGRRREKALTTEQEEQRQVVFERIGLPPSLSLTPEQKGHRLPSMELPPWVLEAMEKWAKSCNTLGQATVGRWLLIASLLRLGPPPGWEGEWPPTSEPNPPSTE